MELLGDGASSVSFICSWKFAVPLSAKTVGVPVLAGTSVSTSDGRLLALDAPEPPPFVAERLVRIRYAGDWPERMALLHDGISSAHSTTAATLAWPPHTALPRTF